MQKITLYVEDCQKEHVLNRVGGKFFNSMSHYIRKLIQDDMIKKEKFNDRKARSTISEMELGSR